MGIRATATNDSSIPSLSENPSVCLQKAYAMMEMLVRSTHARTEYAASWPSPTLRIVQHARAAAANLIAVDVPVVERAGSTAVSGNADLYVPGMRCVSRALAIRTFDLELV